MTNYNPRNLNKLIRWDADWYKFLNDDVKILCLTERQIYLIGQIIDQLQWSNTRWIGDTSGLDFKAIAGNLESAIAEQCEAAMSCETIVDCLENNEATQEALRIFLSQNGYTSSDPDTIKPILSPSDMADNLLPDDYSCTDGQIMATARAIVQLLHNGAMEFLERIELLTDLGEMAVVLGDNFGIVTAAISTPSEFVLWLQDELMQFYEASWSQDVEDSFSCAIYCMAIDDCLINYDGLFSVYTDKLGAIIPPSDVNDIVEIWDWVMGLTLSADESTVAVFHYLALHLLRFGGKFSSLIEDIRSLEQTIQLSKGQFDQSYLLCDDCPPTETATSYWMIFQDLSLGAGDWEVQVGTLQGDGVMSVSAGSPAHATATLRFLDLGAQYQLVGAAIKAQRRGSVGNGTNDICTLRGYELVNQGGLSRQISGTSFITCNTNQCYFGANITGTPSLLCRSLYMQTRVDGVQAYPTNFTKVLKIVFYGLAGPGSTKPPQAIWVSSVPATLPEMLLES